MDLLDNLIQLLEPHQKEFISPYKSEEPLNKLPFKNEEPLKTNLKQKLQAVISNWKQLYNLSAEDCNHLEIQPIGRKNSFYSSLLSLLHPKYSLIFTYSQKQEILENLLRSLISKMEIETKVKMFMKGLNLNTNALIDDIKDNQYQSQTVVYYISLILDLNIIVLSNNDCELYFCEEKYDDCKPHILLYKDSNQIYYPVTYKTLNESQLLSYHDHQLIRNLVDNYNKKVICKKNYEKIVKKREITSSITSYKTLLAADLRKFAELKGLKTVKINEINGRQIYKTKAELLMELDSLQKIKQKTCS